MAVKLTEIGPVSNDGAEDISFTEPYTARLTIEGSSALLFHKWSNEAVAEKGKAAKGSKAKKTDNLESYVTRCENGHLGLPGEYVRMSGAGAARFKQDPRSPRKSLMDLFKAGIVTLTEEADLGVTNWDYEDARRVTIQRNAITRVRPALKAGWRATFEFGVVVPEYFPPMLLHEIFTQAGRLVGVGDFRPTYGRFSLIRWETFPS